MEPIRILHVLASLNRGGAEAMVMSLYRTINRNRFQFDFVVNDQCEKYDHEDEINLLGGRIFRLPRYTILNHISYKNAWKSFFLKHPEIRIVHAHHTSPAFVYLSLANKFNRVTIAHSHISGNDRNVKSSIKRCMRFPIRFLAMHFLACSNDAAQWMFGKKAEVTVVLKNSIESNVFKYNPITREKYRSELHLNDKFIVGHIGRFSNQKNHSFLIKIFNEIHIQNNNAVLLLVGDGPQRMAIEKKIKCLNLEDSVIFTGVRDDIPELLQVMDIFLFPSLYEGLGIVLIEAQAAGLKCFTSADVVPLEAKVTELLEYIPLKKSANKWAEMILPFQNGYKRINTIQKIKNAGYDVTSNVVWLESFYNKIIQSKLLPSTRISKKLTRWSAT